MDKEQYLLKILLSLIIGKVMCLFVSLSYILITCRNCSFISLACIVIESGLAYVFTDLEEPLYLEKLAVVLALCCLKTVIIEPNYLEEKN